MFFKIQPLLYSLIFTSILELVAYREQLFLNALAFLVFFSILVVWPLARKLRFLAIPFFHSLGSLTMLYLIDSQLERHVFIALAALVYYIALLGAYRLKVYDCDQTAQSMVNLATVSTIFFWYVSNYGWFLNYQIEPWVLVTAFATSTFLVSLPSLRICAAMQLRRRKEAIKLRESGVSDEEAESLSSGKVPTYLLINNWVILFLNFILAMMMAQVIWGLSMWPFGHLTTGVTALIIYFVFWDIIRHFVQGTLDRRAVLANIILATLSVAGILLTTRWEIII